MNEVYIIVEEWLPTGDGQELMEIYNGNFYASEKDAWEELYVIAGNVDVELEEGRFSFDVPTPRSGVSSHYYYVSELTRG